jgi:hypothetical protein
MSLNTSLDAIITTSGDLKAAVNALITELIGVVDSSVISAIQVTSNGDDTSRVEVVVRLTQDSTPAAIVTKVQQLKEALKV